VGRDWARRGGDVARDAAAGVGGESELTVSGPTLWALQHPSREAADVDMEPIHSGVAAVMGELDLEIQLILRDGLAAHRAGRTDLRPAPGTVGSSGWQLSRTDRFSGLRAQNLLVGHGKSPGFGRSGRAKCQKACRLFASHWEPDGRRREFTPSGANLGRVAVPENDSRPDFLAFALFRLRTPRGASSRATAWYRSGAAPGSGSQMMSWHRAPACAYPIQSDEFDEITRCSRCDTAYHTPYFWRGFPASEAGRDRLQRRPRPRYARRKRADAVSSVTSGLRAG